MKPEEVIDIVKKSGLRGRGGAEVSYWFKMAICCCNWFPKYVLCNADEGDPGAFMDRSILEGDLVIEAMMICGYAIVLIRVMFMYGQNTRWLWKDYLRQ